MRCDGLHCDGCGRHSAPAALIGGLVAAAIVAANARKVGHAVADVVHFVVLAAVTLIVAAAAAATTMLLIRHHRARARAATQAARSAHIPATVHVIAPPQRRTLPAATRDWSRQLRAADRQHRAVPATAPRPRMQCNRRGTGAR